MDTVTGHLNAPDQRIMLELDARSIEESDAIAAQAQAGPQPPLRSADARRWAQADADALSQLPDAFRQTALDVIARNMLASSTYAEQFNLVAPQHATSAQPVVLAQQVAHVIAAHLPMQPDVLPDLAASWPAQVTDYFRAPGQHSNVQQHVERMLNGINAESTSAFQTRVRSMLAPAPAENKELAAISGLRAHTAWDLTYEEQVRQVARVVSANTNLLPWKVDANLRREPAAVRALLADPAQMRVLEKDVAALVAVPAERVAQVRAMIEQASQPASARVPRPHDGIPRPVMQEDLARSEHALQLVANFIASAQNLTKEAVYTNARYAPPALLAILGNTRKMQELDQALNARLAFIPAGRIADVQATIATALGRADAEQRVHAAQAMAIPAEAPSSSDRPAPETVQRAIDFLATAAALYDDKIPARLANAPRDVATLLADAERMKELDGAINMRLSHILPDRLAAAQATIAVTLNRPDAELRVQVANALQADRPKPDTPQAPATAPAAPARAELQALQDHFRQHITSATPSGDNQLTMQDLYDRIAARHRLYDNLAILTRMEQGQQITGGPKPQALRGIVSPGLAKQWAKLDAADLQSMRQVAGDRLEHLPLIQSAVNLINGTAERDRAYSSSIKRAAPTMREAMEAARRHSESHAVAEFIRANDANPAWKIQSNLERAAPALQRILKDGKRMDDLEAAVQQQLPHVEKQQIDAVRAVIAGNLQRADLAERPAVAPHQPEQSTAPQPTPSSTQAMPNHTAVPQPALQVPKSSPSEASTSQPARNGIIPASATKTDYAPALKKLLEDMSYKIRADGSVLYQVQGKDAFIDHGDQLLMAKGAEKEEREILGALLLAKEKYGGAFELTGSEAFKRAAIDVLVKYQLDVRLKNPEQDLLRREANNKQVQKVFARATPQNPAVPIDLAALAASSAAPLSGADDAPSEATHMHSAQARDRQFGAPVSANSTDESRSPLGDAADAAAPAQHAHPLPTPADIYSVDMSELTEPSNHAPIREITAVDRLTGILLSHGTAPYQNTLRNDTSYFVELMNGDGQIRTHWGQGLADALMVANARIGDEVSLKRMGTIDVTKKVPTWDEHGNFLNERTISGHRNQWEAQILQRLPDSHATPLSDIGSDVAPAVNQLVGTLLRHGNAPYENALHNEPSYFVELMDHDGQVHTQWGQQLAKVLQTAHARIGDKISLKWADASDVTEHNSAADSRTNGEHQAEDSTESGGWSAQILQRRPHSRAANQAMVESAQPVSPSAAPTASLLQGRLIEHGPAPLKNAKDGKPSYFVQIKNQNGESRTFWGLDLERALVKAGVQKGDDIVLQNLGRKPMQVQAPTRDEAGNVVGMGTVISHRNAWEITASRLAARQSEAISAAEAAPALQASSIAVREAAWWQRQIPFLRNCIEETPALLGKIEGLGPRPDSRDVAWIDKHGDRRVVANDISYGALCDRMPSMKATLEPILALEGGTLDGRSQATALKLIHASDNYLQGIAQVDGKVRHVVALLPNAQHVGSHGSDAPIPLMAAIPSPDGFTWERIGQLHADKSAPAPKDSTQTATMHFDVGRESIRVQVHTQPGDALHQRLGLAAASEARPTDSEPTGARQPALLDRSALYANRPTKPDTPTYA